MNDNSTANDSNHAVGTFLSGFLVGGLVGAAAAILTAPQSGRETREQIRTKGVELRDTAGSGLEEAIGSLQEATAEMRSRAEELGAQSRLALEEAQKQWTKRFEETRKVAVATIEELGETAQAGVEETQQALAGSAD